MDAVAGHLSLTSFALEGPPFGGPAAIAYAASHPEKVSHLILWNTWARTADAVGSSQAQSLLALIDKDWEVFTETLAHVVFGWSSGAEAHELAVAFRENFTRDSMLEYLDALIKLDATDFLAQLRSKTLVVHSRESVFPSLNVAQGLASRIADARFVLLEGQSVPWLGDMERNACAHEDFLGTSGGGSPSRATVEAFTQAMSSARKIRTGEPTSTAAPSTRLRG